MKALFTLAAVSIYIVLLFVVARLSGRTGDNAKFFTGGRNQSWWVVALAMVGAPMTGITFISVPGSVVDTGFSYLQMVLGFIVGSVIIAYWLIPLYYRHNVTSLYEYLDNRFGVRSHKMGAWIFLLSKASSASLRVFVVCVVLQKLLFEGLGVPFWATTAAFMLLVWLYTYRGGVRTVVWSDVLKTLCMVLCVVLSGIFLFREIDLPIADIAKEASDKGLSRTFFFGDVRTNFHFVKMFLAGVIMIVVMTGLDQDMMQRALSSPSQRTAQRNMVLASLLQTVVIAMLLCLGAMIYVYLFNKGIYNIKPDEAFTTVASQEGMPAIISVLLVLGVVSASFSSTGGALTSLTTSFAVDIIKNKEISTAARKWLHAAMSVVIILAVLAFDRWGRDSSIEMFYQIAGITYGPLLGLFAFGIFTKREVNDKLVPVVALVPLFCVLYIYLSPMVFNGYTVGSEILLCVGALTMLGLFLISKKRP
jgi:SSS family transporter